MKYSDSDEFVLCYCHKTWIAGFTAGHYYAFKPNHWDNEREMYYITKKGKLCKYPIDAKYFSNFFKCCDEDATKETARRINDIRHKYKIEVLTTFTISDDLHSFYYGYQLKAVINGDGIDITVENEEGDLTKFPSREIALKYGIKMAKKAVNYLYLNKKPITEIIYTHFRGEISSGRFLDQFYNDIGTTTYTYNYDDVFGRWF